MLLCFFHLLSKQQFSSGNSITETLEPFSQRLSAIKKSPVLYTRVHRQSNHNVQSKTKSQHLK